MDAVKETKALVSELCRHFYMLGWVSGTGGSVTIKVHQQNILKSHQLIVMSPSGVQKERMVPEDMYVLSSDGFILLRPLPKPYPHKPPKCTDCAALFLKIYDICNAGAVIHSHAMESCIVTMINPSSKEFHMTKMEMIKGIQGHRYNDKLVVPIVENAFHEAELVDSVTEVIRAYPKSTAVLVRNHGVFIWGATWITAKTQAECYHYLFGAALKLHQLDLHCSCHSSVGVSKRHGRKFPKPRSLGVDCVSEPWQGIILLDIAGTTTPLSFFAGGRSSSILSKHAAADKNEETIEKTGIVFDDVPEALQRWHASGIKVYIYSYHSKEAQHQLFGRSNHGDLRKYICGYFDSTVGCKMERQSYIEISQTVGVMKPSDMLFVTDTFARSSGCESCWFGSCNFH